MIYLDSSVALAELLGETRRPPAEFWRERIVSSRLLEYECWNRVNAQPVTDVVTGRLKGLLDRVAILDLAPDILQRARDPFPIPLRTLDALHLATMHFLREQGRRVELASYDDRLTAAARALDFPIAAL